MGAIGNQIGLSRAARDRRREATLLWVIAGLCILPELVLTGAGLGLWGAPRWRLAAYQYGGFWVGLLGNWRPNYALQPVTMFVSYAFLHAGIAHLVVNLGALAGLGPGLVRRLGPWRFVALYLLSAIGGGLAFGLLTQSAQPMVGASGALFGLAGARVAEELRYRNHRGEGIWPVVETVGILVLLNLLMWAATGGQLAWETHLGGFIAGLAADLALSRTGGAPRR